MVSLTLKADCHWLHWFWISNNNITHPAESITYAFLPNSHALQTLLIYFLKENLLRLGEEVSDSLIDGEASWLKYIEELDDMKSPRLVNSSIADALVSRDIAGLWVSDTLADILWDWLDTLESVADGEMLWVKFAMIFSDAGKDLNKSWVSNLANSLEDSAVLHLHYHKCQLS